MPGAARFPADGLLDRHGVARDDIVSGRGGPGLTGALAECAPIARRHLDRRGRCASTIKPAIAPAFLPVALVERYLRQMEAARLRPVPDGDRPAAVAQAVDALARSAARRVSRLEQFQATWTRCAVETAAQHEKSRVHARGNGS